MNTENNMPMVQTTCGQTIILGSDPQPLARHVVRFMNEVLKSNEGYFSGKKTTSEGKHIRKKCSALAKYLPFLSYYSSLFSPEWSLNPLIAHFLKIYRSHRISEMGRGIDETVINAFDDFLRELRTSALLINLKKKVWDWESKSKKNISSLRSFECACFRRRSRLMATRMDLHFRAALIPNEEVQNVIKQNQADVASNHRYYLTDEDVSKSSVMKARVDFQQVKSYRKRLFTNMKGKPSLFENLVGYVWCIEYSRIAGYHIHLMLLFDGARVHKDEYLAQEIGNYWVKLTDGRGYFENCNRKKWKYGKHSALGMINHWEVDKRLNLLDAMGYFCKSNQMAQVLPYPGCRMFGHGFVRKNGATRSGRPRCHQSDELPANQA